MVLPSSSTKENLIELISSEVCKRFETNKSKRFVVTSRNPSPEQVQHRVRTKRRDLTSHSDEADYIMLQQVHSILSEEGKKSVKVLSSDTDLFFLLCFHFANYWAPKDVYIPTNIRLDEDFLKTYFVFVFRRRLDQDKYVRLSLTSSEDVLVKTNIFVLAIRLQDVFKTFSRRLQDVFKTSCKDIFKTFSRHIIKLNCSC